MKKAAVWILFSLITFCGFAQEAKNVTEENVPMPALEAKRAARPLNPERLIARETYGKGDGKVEISLLFSPSRRAKLEVISEELVVSQEGLPAEPINGVLSLSSVGMREPIRYPLTLDLTLRMDIAEGGSVWLTSITRDGKLSAPAIYRNRIQDGTTRETLAFDSMNGQAVCKLRLVFDGEGNGRLYLLDGSDGSILLGSSPTAATGELLDIQLDHAKLFIKEIAIYGEIP